MHALHTYIRFMHAYIHKYVQSTYKFISCLSLGKEPMGFVHEQELLLTEALLKLQLLLPSAERGASAGLFSLSSSAAATAINLPVAVRNRTGKERELIWDVIHAQAGCSQRVLYGCTHLWRRIEPLYRQGSVPVSVRRPAVCGRRSSPSPSSCLFSARSCCHTMSMDLFKSPRTNHRSR